MSKRPSVVDLRRGRITEKVGHTTAKEDFPNRSTKNEALAKQVDEKRKTLDKLVSKVEEQRKNRIDVENYVKQLETNRNLLQQTKAVHEPEIRSMKERLSKIAVTRNALKKETNVVSEASSEEDLNTKKMMDAIAVAENTLEKLEKKFGANADRIHIIVKETKEQEVTNGNIKKSIEDDEKALKQLEAYLKRTMDITFMEQRKLDDFRLGMNDEKKEIEGMKRRLKEEKAKDRILHEQLDINIKNVKKSEEMGDRMNTTVTKTTESELRELLETTKKMHADLRSKVNKAEEEWIKMQDELSSMECSLAESKASEKVEDSRQRRYETKIEILRLEPAPTMYATYESIVNGQVKKKKRKKDESEGATTEKLKLNRKVEMERLKTGETEKRVNKLKAKLNAIKEEEESILDKIVDGDTVYPEGIFSGTDDDDDDEQTTVDTPLTPRKSKSGSKTSKKGRSKSTGRSSANNNPDAKRRLSLVRNRERDAASVITEENARVEAEAERLQRENVQMEARINMLLEEIEKMQREKITLKEHISEVEKKAAESEKAREQIEVKMKKKLKKKSDEVSTNVARLQEEKRRLEKERAELKNILNQAKQESLRLNHVYKTMRSWQVQCDFEANRRLADDVRQWRATVNQAEKDLEALTNLVEQARQINGAVRKDLALVKPYEEEHAMYIQLKDRAKYLTRKLTEEKSRLESLSFAEGNALNMVSFVGDSSRLK